MMMRNPRLTQQPALLDVLQLLVQGRPLQDVGVLESARPVGFCAEQQSSGVAHQLTAHGVEALLVHVGRVLAVWRFDGHLQTKGEVAS